MTASLRNYVSTSIRRRNGRHVKGCHLKQQLRAQLDVPVAGGAGDIAEALGGKHRRRVAETGVVLVAITPAPGTVSPVASATVRPMML
jgi:hypothetical protein